MTESTITRVLLAVRDEESRSELRRILDQSEDIEVVHEVATGAEFDRVLHGDSPHGCDVAVVDLDLDEPGTLEIARRVAANSRRPRIVVASQYNDSRYVARALHAGAAGYLLIDRAYEELADAVRAVWAGRHFLSSGVAGIQAKE